MTTELAELKTRVYKEIAQYGRLTGQHTLGEPFKAADGPFQYVVISRTTHNKYPEFNRHTLAESTQCFEQALAYAERRQKAGYWVDIYKEIAYATPDYPAND